VSDVRHELAAVIGKAKHFVTEEIKRHPGARVLSSAPMRASASVREAELRQALNRVPQGILPLIQDKGSRLDEVKVVFVSDSKIPENSAAGKLLASIVHAMGLQRNEAALLDLAALETELSDLKPKAVIALGSLAAQSMLKSNEDLGRLRGRFAKFQDLILMPTHHPLELLENAALKRHVWEDMKLVLAKINPAK
jgi:hypothetical protein